MTFGIYFLFPQQFKFKSFNINNLHLIRKWQNRSFSDSFDYMYLTGHFKQTAAFIISALMAITLVYKPIPVEAAIVTIDLPKPGSMVLPSQPLVPAVLKGMTINPQNPLLFEFLLKPSEAKEDQQAIEHHAKNLIQYFFAGLTIKEDDWWVNLSPYEADRMIPDALGQTALGYTMLAQDYLLKQLSATSFHPNRDLGKKFWQAVYLNAQDAYGSTAIKVNGFNKVWIVPAIADIVVDGNTAYITNARLKVMLDEDYVAIKARNRKSLEGKTSRDDLKSSTISSIMRKIIIPALEIEINEGAQFAPLRQVYHALILATWFKRSGGSQLSAKYIDLAKIKGLTHNEPSTNQHIYTQYLQAYKKGAVNIIDDDIDLQTKQHVARKYFSGGEKFDVSQVLRVAPGKLPVGVNSGLLSLGVAGRIVKDSDRSKLSETINAVRDLSHQMDELIEAFNTDLDRVQQGGSSFIHGVVNEWQTIGNRIISLASLIKKSDINREALQQRLTEMEKGLNRFEIMLDGLAFIDSDDDQILNIINSEKIQASETTNVQWRPETITFIKSDTYSSAFVETLRTERKKYLQLVNQIHQQVKRFADILDLVYADDFPLLVQKRKGIYKLLTTVINAKPGLQYKDNPLMIKMTDLLTEAYQARTVETSDTYVLKAFQRWQKIKVLPVMASQNKEIMGELFEQALDDQAMTAQMKNVIERGANRLLGEASELYEIKLIENPAIAEFNTTTIPSPTGGKHIIKIEYSNTANSLPTLAYVATRIYEQLGVNIKESNGFQALWEDLNKLNRRATYVWKDQAMAVNDGEQRLVNGSDSVFLEELDSAMLVASRINQAIERMMNDFEKTHLSERIAPTLQQGDLEQEKYENFTIFKSKFAVLKRQVTNSKRRINLRSRDLHFFNQWCRPLFLSGVMFKDLEKPYDMLYRNVYDYLANIQIIQSKDLITIVPINSINEYTVVFWGEFNQIDLQKFIEKYLWDLLTIAREITDMVDNGRAFNGRLIKSKINFLQESGTIGKDVKNLYASFMVAAFGIDPQFDYDANQLKPEDVKQRLAFLTEGVKYLLVQNKWKRFQPGSSNMIGQLVSKLAKESFFMVGATPEKHAFAVLRDIFRSMQPQPKISMSFSNNQDSAMTTPTGGIDFKASGIPLKVIGDQLVNKQSLPNVDAPDLIGLEPILLRIAPWNPKVSSYNYLDTKY